MSRYPLLASADVKDDEQKSRLEKLRNKILQSAGKYRFTDYHKSYLEKLLRSGAGDKYNIFVTSINVDSNGTPTVHLESDEHYELSELLEFIQKLEYPFSVLFLYYKREEDHSKIKDAIKSAEELPSIVAITYNDPHKILFAFGCELVNWWGLKSVFGDEVEYQELADCIESVINNFERSVPEDQFSGGVVRKNPPNKATAWSNGERYATEPDIEKIRNDAREEQRSDTIKRILDSAGHPRAEHLSTEERLISSQGLFWLAQLDERNDVEEWITHTRLFSEVAPSQYRGDREPEMEFREGISESVSNEFLNKFVQIPSGDYEFGSNRTMVESEPPANRITAHISSFKILRHPVTCRQWNSLVEEPTVEPSQAPVTNINYFEASQFASRLSELTGQKIRLPTEYQWEAAARGPDGYRFPWGDEFNKDYCNCEMQIGEPTPVGSFSPEGDSLYGCQDMAGNVREWTRSYAGTQGVDWQEHSTDKVNDQDHTITKNSRVVIRGGSYSYEADCVQTWVRNTQIASRKDRQTGFRLVIEK